MSSIQLTEYLKRKYFECACFSEEHTLKFSFDPVEKELYASIFLVEDNFWNRLVNGIKYILGYKCKYGHWNTWIFNYEDARMLYLFFQLTVLKDKWRYNPLLKAEVIQKDE